MFHWDCKIKHYFLMSSVMVSGCMLGPDFHAPTAPATMSYVKDVSFNKTEDSQEDKEAGKAQYFHLGETIPATWWAIFHSPTLNELIEIGLKNNPNLAAAQAVLVQAELNYFIQMGTLFPTLVGSFPLNRQRFNPSLFGDPSTRVFGIKTFNLFTPNATVSYTFDAFGKLHRQIEMAGAQVDYQQYEVEGAFLTLSSNIVTTAIAIASLRAQVQALQALIVSQEKTLELMKKQFNLGSIPLQNLLSQETQVEQTRSLLPQVEQDLVKNRHALSVLIGELPSEEGLAKFDLDTLHLPKDLPVSCPSSFVRQRPDIKAAEALLHAASAKIGAAVANLYPQINLVGDYGSQALSWNTLFEPSSIVWSVTGTFAQTIFNAGVFTAQKDAAIAAYQQAAAQYKQTVLHAFQEVADTLRALEHDAQIFKAHKKAELSAKQALQLTQKQYQLGGVDYLTLLNAQRTYQKSLIRRIRAQTARYSDTAALFQALGGGWWNRGEFLSHSPALIGNMQQYQPPPYWPNP